MITPENARLALQNYLSKDIPSVSYFQKSFTVTMAPNVNYNISLPNMFVTALFCDSSGPQNNYAYSFVQPADYGSQPLTFLFKQCCTNNLSIRCSIAITCVVTICGYMTDNA